MRVKEGKLPRICTRTQCAGTTWRLRRLGRSGRRLERATSINRRVCYAQGGRGRHAPRGGGNQQAQTLCCAFAPWPHLVELLAPRLALREALLVEVVDNFPCLLRVRLLILPRQAHHRVPPLSCLTSPPRLLCCAPALGHAAHTRACSEGGGRCSCAAAGAAGGRRREGWLRAAELCVSLLGISASECQSAGAVLLRRRRISRCTRRCAGVLACRDACEHPPGNSVRRGSPGGRAAPRACRGRVRRCCRGLRPGVVALPCRALDDARRRQEVSVRHGLLH